MQVVARSDNFHIRKYLRRVCEQQTSQVQFRHGMRSALVGSKEGGDHTVSLSGSAGVEQLSRSTHAHGGNLAMVRTRFLNIFVRSEAHGSGINTTRVVLLIGKQDTVFLTNGTYGGKHLDFGREECLVCHMSNHWGQSLGGKL